MYWNKNIVAVVFFASAFLCACTGGDKKAEELRIADSLDSVKKVIDSLKKNEAAKPEFLVITGTNVNMRKAPDLKSIRIRQLKLNDTCPVIEKGKKDTINDVADYWYKIKSRTKEGWVFGAFTSAKIKEEKKDKNIFFKKKTD